MLEGIPIFAGLQGEVLDDIAEHGERIEAEPGQCVVAEGEPGNAMYLVLKGRVGVEKQSPDGGVQRLALLERGDFFGEMSIVECMPRSASVRAVEPVVLFRVKASELLRIFHLWPDQNAILLLNIARDLCRRLRKMDQYFADTPDAPGAAALGQIKSLL